MQIPQKLVTVTHAFQLSNHGNHIVSIVSFLVVHPVGFVGNVFSRLCARSITSAVRDVGSPIHLEPIIHCRPRVRNIFLLGRKLECIARPYYFYIIFGMLNSSPPGQNGRHFGRRHFQKPIFENDMIPIQISLKFVLMCPIDNKPALVQVTAWRRTGDKALPETMLPHFPGAYMRH